MFNPIEISRVFGPLLIIMGVWSLLYQNNVKKVSEAFKKNVAIHYLGALINLIIGLLVIYSSPNWGFHLTVLVTILGWVFFLKGLIFFILPNFFIKIFSQKKSVYMLSGLISIIWGLAFVWFTFMKV